MYRFIVACPGRSGRRPTAVRAVRIGAGADVVAGARTTEASEEARRPGPDGDPEANGLELYETRWNALSAQSVRGDRENDENCWGTWTRTKNN